MATYRVWMNGDNTDGQTWAKAYTSINNVPALSSGDEVWVHTGTTPHSESHSAENVSITGPSSGAPAYFIGVDKDNSDAYLKATTDLFVTTGGTYDVSFDGSFALFGLRFNSSDRTIFNAPDANETCYVQDCYFDNQADLISISYGNIEFFGCDFVLGSAGYLSTTGGNLLTLVGGSITGSKTYFADVSADLTLIGVDISAHSGSEIMTSPGKGKIELIGCKLKTAAYSLSTTAFNRIKFYGTDSDTAHNQWRHEIQQGAGGSVVLTGTVYRDSGAATYDGTNEYSYQIAGSSNDDDFTPMYTDWSTGYLPADSGTQTTWSVHIANTTGTLTDRDVFLEVEYYGSATSTLKTVKSSRPESPRTSGTNIPTDTGVTWAGITGETVQLISVGPFTVNKAGMYRWRVGTGTTTTAYVCPKLDVTQA